MGRERGGEGEGVGVKRRLQENVDYIKTLSPFTDDKSVKFTDVKPNINNWRDTFRCE